jgi:hypothetical protein
MAGHAEWVAARAPLRAMLRCLARTDVASLAALASLRGDFTHEDARAVLGSGAELTVVGALTRAGAVRRLRDGGLRVPGVVAALAAAAAGAGGVDAAAAARAEGVRAAQVRRRRRAP